MPAAQSPVDLVWPETGSSEDLPGLFGPVTLPAIPIIPTAAPPPPIQPAPLPVAPPVIPQPQPAAAPALPQRPVMVQAPMPPQRSAFPPPPPLPSPVSLTPSPATPAVPATVAYPHTSQVDVKPAEVQAQSQAQLPYTMSSVTVPKPTVPVPVPMSHGGNLIEVSKEKPAWMDWLLKGVFTLTVIAILAGLGFAASFFITNNPDLFASFRCIFYLIIIESKPMVAADGFVGFWDCVYRGWLCYSTQPRTLICGYL
jgi:hypothetical protein